VIVAIKGGLGNQLFQAAFALVLQRHTGRTVWIDARDFPNRGREFMLDRIGCKLPVASEKQIFSERWASSLPIAKARHWMNRLTGAGTVEPGIFREPERWCYHESVFTQHPRTYFSGYWMSLRYYPEGFPGESEFPFLGEDWPDGLQPLAKDIADCESVGVHVRRGDYAADPRIRADYLVCGSEYYRRSMSRLAERLPHPKFFLFSDDEDFLRSVDWGGLNVTVVPAVSGVGDEHYLRLLASCRHQIISNSTFSWWAAFLNRKPERIVVCPDRWRVSIPTGELVGELIPEDWLLESTPLN